MLTSKKMLLVMLLHQHTQHCELKFILFFCIELKVGDGFRNNIGVQCMNCEIFMHFSDLLTIQVYIITFDTYYAGRLRRLIAL